VSVSKQVERNAVTGFALGSTEDYHVLFGIEFLKAVKEDYFSLGYGAI
jgi:hypothetical protein